MEPSWDRFGVFDGARIEHGVVTAYCAGEEGAHGMRGDAVAVGHIDEMQGWSLSPRDTASGNDGGDAGREHDAGVVGGHGGIERDAPTEQCGDGVGVDDGARGEHGACDAHGAGSGGTNGMRGDAVGIGDIGEMPADARGPGDTAGVDDAGEAGWEHDAGVVGGCGGIERDKSWERCGDRVGVGDGARDEHGACNVHERCSGGAHGMRGDAVGIGHIGEMPGDARSPGDKAARVDGRGTGSLCLQNDEL